MCANKKANDDSLIVVIRDLNTHGQGVGVIENDPSGDCQGMICFVDGALPGERISGTLRERKRNYLIVTLDQVLEPSLDRIDSDCRYFPECGSCRLRHLNYPAELAVKEKHVRDLLSRNGLLGHDSPVFKQIMGMKDPLHYRGKSIFPVTSDPAGSGLLIGQYRYGSHDLVDLHDCHIQSRPALALVNRIRELASRDQVTAYDERTHDGTLRHLLIRTGFSSQEIMVVFVVNDRQADEAITSWLPLLKDTIKPLGFALQSSWINDMDTRGNRILSSKYRHLDGSQTIEEIINGVTYKISPDSFFQVNPRQAAVLFDEVIRAAELQPGERVLDLYSGVGAISLQFASAGKELVPPLEVTGVDRVKQAVMDARANAKINELVNLSFIEADATEWLKDYEDNAENQPFNIIVVDPPRKGLDPKALDVLRESGTPEIIYVSCNPATLARDLALLSDVYGIESVQPIDMFPRTTHVETVVLMSRKG